MHQTGRWDRGGGGGLVHLLYDGEGPGLPLVCHLCGLCADFLCDFPIGEGVTCDRPMCSKCRCNVGEELDYCPPHHKEWRTYRESGGMVYDLIRQQPQQVLPDKG